MNNRHVSACLCVVAVLVAVRLPTFADEPSAPKKIVTVEGITEYQLDNGLRLLFFPDQSRSKVTVNMTVLVGRSARPILKKTFAEWNAAKPYARIIAPVPKDLKGSQQRLNTPDKANATYNAGLVFPLRDDDPDYPALLIANFIYGGGSLSSRLGTRVRQREGLSYGVGASFNASSFEPRATMMTNAICNPQNIGKVEVVIAEELDRLLHDGVTMNELEEAKQGYLESQKATRSSDSRLAGTLAGLSYTGRTMAYQAELEKKIEALTPEQVLAAVRKHIDPKKVVIVSAGDFDAKSTGTEK